MPIEKECKKCKLTRPATAFDPLYQTTNGKVYTYLQPVCKPCKEEQGRLASHKICKDCKIDKPASEFQLVRHKYKNHYNYAYQSYCKPCEIERGRIWRQRKNITAVWKESHTPVSWYAMKGRSDMEKHHEYPICRECTRRYIKKCYFCTVYKLAKV